VLKRAKDRDAYPIYLDLLGHEELRTSVIPLLGEFDDPAIVPALLGLYPELTLPRERVAIIGALTARPSLAAAFLREVRAKRFDRELISSAHARQLRSQRDPVVAQLVHEIWGGSEEVTASSPGTILRYERLMARAPQPDLAAGKRVYQQLCSACHTMDGEGGKLGPDLTGSSGNGTRYFIENIVDPNAVVGENFQLNLLTKTDGSVLSGMVESQTETALVIRTMIETVTVPKSEVRERQVMPQSLMPPGLLESLSEKEAIDLISFLTKKP
jgi:putative heme-binding domain-containing protein